MSDFNNPLQDKVWKDLILRYLDEDLREAEIVQFNKLMEDSETFRVLFNKMSQLEMDLSNPPYVPSNITPIFPEKPSFSELDKPASNKGVPFSKVAALLVMSVGLVFLLNSLDHKGIIEPTVVEPQVTKEEIPEPIKAVQQQIPELPMGGGRLTSKGAKVVQENIPVPKVVRYNQHVRPILSDRCFFCHGPDEDENKGDLRLDERAAAIEAGAITPGFPEKSEIIVRIMHHDEDEKMPPEESNKTISPSELAILKKWITEGANYEKHWAYSPMKRELEKTVDQLVNLKYKQENLKPSKSATAYELTRRMYLDVTGLPPKASDLPKSHKMSETDISNMIDKLLASPHYGERMAVWWMDAVRYADTAGYHGDQNVMASPYRDYIIKSFNKNKSFKDFTIEQIAGDLIPDATLEQRIGASYLRLNQSSTEGGIQNEEYLKKYQSERVRTTSTAWMGSTLACSECHNHKFDPFTAEDFYSFAAFFTDILEKGAYTGQGSFQEKDLSPYYRSDVRFTGRGPQLVVASDAQNKLLVEKKALSDKARGHLYNGTLKNEAEYTAWLTDLSQQFKGEKRRDIPVFNLGDDKVRNRPVGTIDPIRKGMVPMPLLGKGTAQLKIDKKDKNLKKLTIDLNSNKLKVVKGDSLYVYVYAKKASTSEQWNVKLQTADNKWLVKSFKGKDFEGGILPRDQWTKLNFTLDKLEEGKDIQINKVVLEDLKGNSYWDNIGVSTKNVDTLKNKLPADLKTGIILEASKREKKHKNALSRYFRDHHQSYIEERFFNQLKSSEYYNYFNSLPTTPATISAKPREVRILPRGNWMDKTGKLVQPATPSFLPTFSEESEIRKTRLDLANWLTHDENPLTARVFVNRLWAAFFGVGLSKVVDDFGMQGEWPEHPELLDWLALEFVKSGWDVKHIVKTILMSKTYQQSSAGSTTLNTKDPENRFLARQTPRRLDAEFIRDQALASSGLLNSTLGGASAKPYQPEGYYAHLNFPRRTYKSDDNENQYRRGLYTHWQRTFLHPMMQAFDAPSRDECAMTRDKSNTPLQSLVLLNDPTFVEAARFMAAKLTKLKTDEEKLEQAYLDILSRPIDKDEFPILLDLLKKERVRAQQSPERVKSFQKVGRYRLPQTVDPIEATALAAVTRTLYNLHETVTRY